MSPTRSVRRVALALTLGAALVLGAAGPAGAEKYPDLHAGGRHRSGRPAPGPLQLRGAPVLDTVFIGLVGCRLPQ